MSDRGYIAGAEPERVYVDVVANITPEGLVTPLEIWWSDGRRYRVDTVVERRPARSLKDGGTGMRYTIRVGHTQTYLFFDDARGAWFVKARTS